MCEICQNWERLGEDTLKISKKLLMPEHHPNCPHYNDSLIDVWRITDGSTSCYVGSESEAEDMMQSESSEGGEVLFRLEKRQMHREIFERLPEFDGF